MGLEDFVKKELHHMFSSDEAGTPQTPPATAPLDTMPTGPAATSTTSATPAAAGRVLLIHGYSAEGEDFLPWKQALLDAGIKATPIEIGNYVTLNNDVSIKDLGEAFDRALQETQWSTDDRDDIFTFDAIVHSTGMLVLRQWLSSDPFPPTELRSRIRRLKHLVGLAPATFGSPQAKKGRSWLGALVKGNKHLGPDFMNAGNEVLDGLELGSRYTWELAHKDMLAKQPLYDKGSNTPYVAIFIGNVPYDGIAAISNSPGTDGTVRWAGCALDTRKVSIDFRREGKLLDDGGNKVRFSISKWLSSRLGAQVIAVEGRNHGTIIQKPDPQVADLIASFFAVSDEPGYLPWAATAQQFGAAALAKMDTDHDKNPDGAGWQQLAVRVSDDHDDGVNDYNLQLYIGNDLAQSDDPEFEPIKLIVDTYSGDSSFRSFYIKLTKDMLAVGQPGAKHSKLWLEIVATSGTNLIEYEAYIDDSGVPHPLTLDHSGVQPVKLDLTPMTTGEDKLLYPYTTTLLEIFLDREPIPLGDVSKLFTFIGRQSKKTFKNTPPQA